VNGERGKEKGERKNYDPKLKLWTPAKTLEGFGVQSFSFGRFGVQSFSFGILKKNARIPISFREGPTIV
jgi:hypothetical protein